MANFGPGSNFRNYYNLKINGFCKLSVFKGILFLIWLV